MCDGFRVSVWYCDHSVQQLQHHLQQIAHRPSAVSRSAAAAAAVNATLTGQHRQLLQCHTSNHVLHCCSCPAPPCKQSTSSSSLPSLKQPSPSAATCGQISLHAASQHPQRAAHLAMQQTTSAMRPCACQLCTSAILRAAPTPTSTP
jgi:hypothetical protein